MDYSPWDHKESDTTEWLTFKHTACSPVVRTQFPLLSLWGERDVGGTISILPGGWGTKILYAMHPGKKK